MRGLPVASRSRDAAGEGFAVGAAARALRPSSPGVSGPGGSEGRSGAMAGEGPQGPGRSHSRASEFTAQIGELSLGAAGTIPDQISQ